MKESLQVIKDKEQNSRALADQFSILPVMGLNNQEPKTSHGINEYLRAIQRRIWLILAITLLSTSLASVYMARQQDVYEAQARVQVDLENNPAMNLSGSGSSSQVNDPTYFSTQLQILMGSGLLRRVAKTLDLEHSKQFRGSAEQVSTWTSLLRMFGLKDAQSATPTSIKDELPLSPKGPPSSSEDLEEARRLAPYVSRLQRGLTVEPVKDARVAVRETRLIDIRFQHRDPQIAAKVANAVANALVLSNLEQRTASSSFAGDFLQKRIEELQTKIRTDEERLLNYAQEHKIISLDPGQNVVVDRLAALNAQLLGAENERKAAEAAYRSALAPGAAEAATESRNASASAARATLATLRLRRAQLLAETTEEWPEVKEIDKQIVELEKQISESNKREVSILTTTLESKFREALAKEQSFKDAFEKARAETVTQNEATVNYKIIQQEVDTSKSLLDGLLKRSKENDVVLAAIPNNIHITDFALTPDSPVGPKRLLGVFVALVCSLAFGLGVALLMGQLDDAIYTTDELERTLNLPLIGAIPPIGNLKARTGLKLLNFHNGRGNGNNSLIVRSDVRSPFSESYRKLRTMLLRSDGNTPRTLLITSSIPCEGKTTTTLNAASVLASAGLKVLVIDADLRHPSHHAILDLSNKVGLSTVILPTSSQTEILAAIQLDPESGVHVLTAGPETRNPAEVISTEHMQRLLANVTNEFDHVIIDAPPIAYFAESVLLASLVDGVVLVVGSGKTSRKILKRSHKELQEVGANILGMVLNNVKVRQQDYYSYYKAS